MARSVIFDLDGTLLDSVRDLAVAANAVLEERGLPPHDLDGYRRFVGDGARMLVVRALGVPPDHPDAAPALARFRELYFQRMTVHTEVYPGIPELLATLQERGVPTAILSNKPHEATVQVVRHYFPEHPFVEVYGQREGVPKKPDPVAAFELAEKLGHPPAEIAFVGDSDVDMRTAHAAGMRAIGVAWGLRGRAELEAENASAVIDRADELLGVLGV